MHNQIFSSDRTGIQWAYYRMTKDFCAKPSGSLCAVFTKVSYEKNFYYF